MMTRKYVCPGCYKNYSTLKEVRACILEDEKRMEAEIEKEKTAKIEKLKSDINKLQKELDAAIKEYNKLNDGSYINYSLTILDKSKETVLSNGIDDIVDLNELTKILLG